VIVVLAMRGIHCAGSESVCTGIMGFDGAVYMRHYVRIDTPLQNHGGLLLLGWVHVYSSCVSMLRGRMVFGEVVAKVTFLRGPIHIVLTLQYTVLLSQSTSNVMPQYIAPTQYSVIV
jgi:hypothetical protein